MQENNKILQQQGRKIQEVLKRKGLKQYLFVEGLGWNATAFSKKVKHDSVVQRLQTPLSEAL